MIVATNCPNCETDQPVEVKEQRFELYTKDTDKGFLPVSCTVCGATWELHYRLVGEESVELDGFIVDLEADNRISIQEDEGE